MSGLQFDPQTLEAVIQGVLSKLNANGVSSAPAPAPTAAPSSKPACGCTGGSQKGVFTDADKAIEAANHAYKQLCNAGVEARAKVVEIVKGLCMQNAKTWGEYEFNETKIGRLEHKPGKLELVNNVPGVEWLNPRGMSGDHGITLEEYTPFGVIGAILPMTHSIPTMAGNIVNMVAAGNSIVFNPHPGGARSACLATAAFNDAIERATGIRNLICTLEQPTLDTFAAITQSPGINILCITGGPAVVDAAMQSGKRAICAGPGNPPVLVDETADIDKAAASIIAGGAFDNNLLCIGEKAVFVVDQVFNQFMAAMEKHGGHRIVMDQFKALADIAFDTKEGAGGCSHKVLNRNMVGKGAVDLANLAGFHVAPNTELLFGETHSECVFVEEEQMMGIMPIVRVKNVEEGIELSKKTEHGYRHSAMIHSHNVNNMTAMARALDTTIFVKNGPCVAGLGVGGEGYISFSIATTTGEGITNPQTFTRVRRCTMVDNLKIY